MVLEGRRIASGASRKRKVRTPQGVMPRNSGFNRRYMRAESCKTFRRKVPQKIRPPASASSPVRVKRWCKRPPREAQATRHGKPHRVQGQIGNPGAARSAFRESETGFGYRSLRQMILSVRKDADRIRLTALPKPFSQDCCQKTKNPHAGGWRAGLVFAQELLLDEAVEDVGLRAIQGHTDGVVVHAIDVHPAGRVGEAVAVDLQRVG